MRKLLVVVTTVMLCACVLVGCSTSEYGAVQLTTTKPTIESRFDTYDKIFNGATDKYGVEPMTVAVFKEESRIRLDSVKIELLGEVESCVSNATLSTCVFKVYDPANFDADVFHLSCIKPQKIIGYGELVSSKAQNTYITKFQDGISYATLNAEILNIDGMERFVIDSGYMTSKYGIKNGQIVTIYRIEISTNSRLVITCSYSLDK